ncbi:hypothetical protein GGTG_03479 [Gaeumannomyces tritici R3-111a-1]|uniref:Uncharacterized protein n=1 Tax=Gaeumannomyces tritici (strain R3-111a-1) TaxID=644352 RepID=J3NQC2_GAET3|nr:hypothetical protein GGTG_03479 [Gaeumannomyces tritici R3-111a-1]EJT78378.1 hypothetical protein GGTG_03479 [Gaeumannomyces tritici R3-111a-1]
MGNLRCRWYALSSAVPTIALQACSRPSKATLKFLLDPKGRLLNRYSGACGCEME